MKTLAGLFFALAAYGVYSSQLGAGFIAILFCMLVFFADRVYRKRASLYGKCPEHPMRLHSTDECLEECECSKAKL